MKKATSLVMVSLLLVACNTIQNANKLTVPVNQTRNAGFYASLNADCTSYGDVEIRVTSGPSHGRVKLERGTDYPSYTKENQRYQCNEKRVPGVRIMYSPNPGYLGPDNFTAQVIFPTGHESIRTVNIEVK